MNVSLLKNYGIDYQKGLERCFNDEAIYKALLSAFLQDTTFSRAQSAYTNNDFDTLFKCSHELKGASGNATFTALFAASSALVEYMRSCTSHTCSKQKLDSLFSGMTAAYLQTKEGVSAALL